jgi:hypothetical protein
MKLFSMFALGTVLFVGYQMINDPTPKAINVKHELTNPLSVNPKYHNLTNDPNMNGLTNADGTLIIGTDLIIYKPAWEMGCSITVSTMDSRNPEYVQCVTNKIMTWTDQFNRANRGLTQKQRDCIFFANMKGRNALPCAPTEPAAVHVYTQDLAVAYAEIKNIETLE